MVTIIRVRLTQTRHRDAGGQHIDVSLCSASLAFLFLDGTGLAGLNGPAYVVSLSCSLLVVIPGWVVESSKVFRYSPHAFSQ